MWVFSVKLCGHSYEFTITFWHWWTFEHVEYAASLKTNSDQPLLLLVLCTENYIVVIVKLFMSYIPRNDHPVCLWQGSRKVIVSTNISETSVTIHGIKHVIDTGMVKAKYVGLGHILLTVITELGYVSSVKYHKWSDDYSISSGAARIHLLCVTDLVTYIVTKSCKHPTLKGGCQLLSP